jgi:hypothetical protein
MSLRLRTRRGVPVWVKKDRPALYGAGTTISPAGGLRTDRAGLFPRYACQKDRVAHVNVIVGDQNGTESATPKFAG